MNEELLDEFGDPIPQDNQDQSTTVVTNTETPKDEFFLKTQTGTVYKTADDAIRGTEQKDALIQKLREEAIARTGTDPVTGRLVQRTDAPVDYTQDGERFLTDLAAAAKSGDSKAYARIQQKMAEDVLAPYAPVLTNLAKNQAISGLNNEIQGFNNFIASNDYSDTLAANPALRDAIAFAETNPSQSSKLGEFYKMAFGLNVARKLPEAGRTYQPTVVPRQTASSTVQHAPNTNNGQVVQPSMDTSEGRKALIERMERQGVGDLRF